MRKGFFYALGTAGALLVMALPAQATVLDEPRHYEFSESNDETICGFDVRVDFASSGTARVRAGKHDLDTAYFGLDNYEFTATITNTANGRFFTEWGNGVFRDVKATHISGTIFEFTTVESGRPYNLSDASGRVLVRDRGSIRQVYRFDTDPVGHPGPGGIFLEDISERVSGPHPGFFMSEEEFCAVVTPLLS